MSREFFRKVADKQHIKLTYITHFYCNQQDISEVINLLREYESMPASVLDYVQFVIVDDCSPLEYEIPEFDLNLTWLRITTDIPWNQGGSRNLGVTYAASDKILMTDLDHVLPVSTFTYLINAANPGRTFYKLYRRDEQGNLRKGHSNLFFMSRARFFRFYGYDEEFCGHYGAEDYRFVKLQKYHGSRQRYLPKSVYATERIVDRDKSYHTLDRSLEYNTPVDKRKHEEVCTYGAESGHSRLFLDFEWKILRSVCRTSPVVREKNPGWKARWWLRWLFAPLAK